MPDRDVYEAEFIGINDIPLAYINTYDTKLKVDIKIDKKFLEESSVPIRPYSEVKDPEVLYFDSNNQIVDVELKRMGNTYTYEPQEMTEFSPEMFSTYALVKKNITFRNNQSYNLKISVIEDTTDLVYASNMIKIFADAYRRGIAPPNITVNNKSLKIESLVSSTLSDNDFVFARSIDGKNITDEDGKVIQDINVEDLLDNHVNVWLSVDRFSDLLVAPTGDLKSITLNFQPVVYSSREYGQQAKTTYIFAQDKVNTDYPASKYIYDFVANSVLILEKARAGFLIITPSFVLNNLDDNAKLIYEILMHVFLKAYYQSAKASSWITDNPVDYMAYSKKKLNIRHKSININNLLSNNNYEINNEYNLLMVETDNEKVKFNNLTPKGELFFYKTIKTDPVKKDNEISYLTTKETIVNYLGEGINIVETKINIDSVIIDNIAYITVHPYINSLEKIHTSTDQIFSLSDLNINYYICTKPTSVELENIFTFVHQSDYSYEKDGFIVAYVRMTAQRDTKVYDVRVSGGGLSTTEPNNYDMIDIGNLYGRPYRIGSALIIKLPKNCKQYHDLIIHEVNKHITSGDYPIILYE